MTVAGVVQVRCPACALEHTVRLVQSINTRTDPELKEQLLRGELALLACSCGKRTRLAATLLYHDPTADYFCQVCPGGDAAMARGAEAFAAVPGASTRRLVPSLDALVEKVKVLDAGLDDRVIEMIKVLLLASIEESLDTILLFEAIDHAESVLRWALLGEAPRLVTSPFAAYERLAAKLLPSSDLRVDRMWAVEAVRTLVSETN